jgi:phosphoribosyl-ATP pyrophosphohydrolase/phosphoribosyl-AMP cyclohydrolase
MTLPDIQFDASGLVPVVVQHVASGEVLTVAYANSEAIERTLETGEAHFWSRTRQEMWRKGATSGSIQRVLEVRYDCDSDALLYRVDPAGPACHTGKRTCFYRTVGDIVGPSVGEIILSIEETIADRIQQMPEGSYVVNTHNRGVGYVAQKVVEEAGETVVAALQDQDEELVQEAADLIFHLLMLLRERGVAFEQVAGELAKRY